MKDITPIRDLFVSDVTRDIPPVVYFHEQSPEKLAAEVGEYIVTGGWPEDHPNHRRVPEGIHEQYVRLLDAIAAELARPGGPDLPNIWISGFFGSGKSIFAKLLGLALDGVPLPDGTALAEAWLRRDTSPRASELRDAWTALRRKIDPIAVVFDVGSVARDNEQVHAVAVRQVQRRLGYCPTEPLVADFELTLERDGHWARFEQVAQETLGEPWEQIKGRDFAEEDFSLVMSRLFPDYYTDPMAWFTSRAGTHLRNESPEEAVRAISDMLRFRRPNATLFLVVDEVSQYVLSSKDRVDRLRAFATALGAGLKGRVWLLALGQQKLDEDADQSFLIWAKDRFPPKLRVHLAATNIRDVVHKRLLHKTPAAEAALRALFEAHRADLKLFAYGCESVTIEDLIEVYPLLPGHIDLLLQMTSAMRSRSRRVQGDDQAIRGLLQMLGELFRAQRLADLPVGHLISLDLIYEVQHSALDSDIQASMARILNQCAEEDGLLIRAAKTVALLELIQDVMPTDTKLVAQCLYDRLDRGSQITEITEALETLRRRNLLGYSEKTGYKIQSSAGEEWERERADIPVPRETIGDGIKHALEVLLAAPERPRLQGRPFPWAGLFSDARSHADSGFGDQRSDAVVQVDFRFLPTEERAESLWVKRSAESTLENRILWVCGDTDALWNQVRELARSRGMLSKFNPRRESLSAARKLLLEQERIREEELEKAVQTRAMSTWMTGRLYFRGRSLNPGDLGGGFAGALEAAGTRLLPELYPHFVVTDLQPGELLHLLETDLTGPSPKLMTGELGILELDHGRYEPTCGGAVPKRVQDFIESEGGLGGTALLTHFGRPPYGYTANVVKACVAGLLRGNKLRIQPEGTPEITAVRDAGVRDLFEKDRSFRRANIFPSGEDDIGYPVRARICKFFEKHLGTEVNRSDDAIADAVANLFPGQAQRLRAVLTQLNRLPDGKEPPAALTRLQDALEQSSRQVRQTRPTVQQVKRHLDALADGIELVNLYSAELSDTAVSRVMDAARIRDHEASQLQAVGALDSALEAARGRIETHLAGERPWRDITALEPDLAAIRAAYCAERERRLARQEQQAEQARGRIRSRDGFATLTADQSHSVLRPIALAVTDTTEDAVAPSLDDLETPFLVRLEQAEQSADDILDGILSAGRRPLIVKMDLSLRNREIATEADVDSLLEEIRKRLLEQIDAGVRVRIL
ncbi:BREX system P-loop protein BrxC [Thiocapsa sp.]|uniref:BREX system P-loop protein BrxC n=1 Tax=Thiocapsa sp. TaxID=2024551 RepID=UPI00359370A4